MLSETRSKDPVQETEEFIEDQLSYPQALVEDIIPHLPKQRCTL